MNIEHCIADALELIVVLFQLVVKLDSETLEDSTVASLNVTLTVIGLVKKRTLKKTCNFSILLVNEIDFIRL